MGLITNLVKMKAQQDAAQKVGAMQALTHAMGNPNISPEGYNWASQAMIDIATGAFGEGGKGKGQSKGGDKSGVGGFFQHLMGGLQRMNPYQASPGIKSGVQEEMRGTTRNPRPDKMFLDQNEQDFLKQQQLMASEQIKNQMALQYDREKGQQAYEERVKQADSLKGTLSPSQLTEFKLTGKLPTSTARSQIIRNTIDPDHPEEGPKIRIDHIDGTHEFLPEVAAPQNPKPDTDSGAALKELESIERILADPKADPIRKKAAQERKKQIEDKDKAQQTRLAITVQNAAQNNQQAKPDVTNYWADYISRGGHVDYGLLRGLGKKQIADIMAEVPKIAASRGMSVGDMLATQSDIASAKIALTKMETQFAQTSAFEKTARANLDRAITAAQKIVDSGSPVVNRPWRTAEKELYGKPGYAAFHAARVVAFTEVAKVLNNPMGSGAVSDTARKEAESALSENATLPQLKAAADILRQDMSSRIASMKQTIDETKQQIAKPPSTITPTTPEIKIISIK